MLRPDRHKDRNERSHCDYVHKWKKLRHPVYERNRLPPNTPPHLRTFLASDWGTGHGEAPQFEFAFEDTYHHLPNRGDSSHRNDGCKPEKWDEFTRPLLKANTVLKTELPNPSWSAVVTQLCYHFSMKEEKCPHWQNCIFLHVDSKRLKEKFKQYKCMCGPHDGLCKYGKFGTCFYAHRQSELTMPSDPHRIVLAHPFFWSSQKGLHFLVTLGTYKTNPRDTDIAADLRVFRNLRSEVQEAIKQALPDGKRWFDAVQDLEQTGKHETADYWKQEPFGLLKFIRNKYIHLNDSDMSAEIRAKLSQYVFQHRFPQLVARSWEAVLDSLDIIQNYVQHAQLYEFFARPVEVESFRSL